MAGNLTDRVRAVVAAPVAASGADLEGLDVRAAGRRRVVRIVIDTDAGVTLDEVAEVTAAVSKALDASDVMGDSPYVLEVTSPGVERPLTEPKHWRRNSGRLVRVRLRDGSDPVVGRITASTDTEVTLDLDGVSRGIALADVDQAVIQVEFNRAEGQ